MGLVRMESGTYLTISKDGRGFVREKASRFMGFAFPIADEEDLARRVRTIAKEHHASRHVCWARVLGERGENHRANDAGEPNGTAGKPILRRLQAADLTFSAVVVVRYFGGTLLGKGGLVQAYGEAAQLALADAVFSKRTAMAGLRVECAYPLVEAVKRDVTALEGQVIAADYGERCVLRVEVPRGRTAVFTERWRMAGALIDNDQEK